MVYFTFMYLWLEVGSNRNFFGSDRLEAYYLWPGLDPGRKKWARARPGPEKTGSTQPYIMYTI